MTRTKTRATVYSDPVTPAPLSEDDVAREVAPPEQLPPTLKRAQARRSAEVQAYADLVDAVRELGPLMRAGLDARHVGSPSMAREKSAAGVSNPTLDIVSDPRRAAVSDAVSGAATAMDHFASVLRSRANVLSDALDRYDGQ